MGEAKASKITISLRKDLLDLADRLAREDSTTRSGVIAQLLERADRERVEALMEEGDREMADENRQLAQEIFPVVSEVIMRDTQWES